MSEKTEYRELFNLNSSRLSKNDLLQLEKILVEDPKTDQIDIKLSFDSTTISAESFEELVSKSGIPLSTDKLSIDMNRWIDKGDYKGISSGVSLSLHFNHITCQIHSIDQTWFLGKKHQIEKFFKTKRPWYSWLNTLVFLYPNIAILLAVYGAVLFSEKQYVEMILPIFSSIAFLSVTALVFKQKLFPFVKVYLQEREKNTFGFNEWCALVGALSGFATLVQLIDKMFK
jgi:hypothetical protein